MQREHQPVLLKETLSLLNIRSGGVYLDCTLGDGGHALSILQASSPDGRLIGIDRDPEVSARVSKKFHAYAHRCQFITGNYRDLFRLVREAGFDSVDGVLMDLGVSMVQLKSPSRGFSFLVDAPLDMRMNAEEPIPTACDLINDSDGDQLRRILVDYGEEKRWRSIVKAIQKARENKPIRSTRELADLIERALPGARRYKIHPATRTFQALRIAVNDELKGLEEGLTGAVGRLRTGGRLCVISFHSLEDRIVKQMFQGLAKGCTCPNDFPVCTCGKSPLIRKITRKPVLPSAEECRKNPSARSARLRAAETIREAA